MIRACVVAQLHRFVCQFNPEHPESYDPTAPELIIEGFTLPSQGFIQLDASGSCDADIWPEVLEVRNGELWVKSINQKLEVPPDLLGTDEKPWQPDVPDKNQLTTESRVLVGLARSQFNSMMPFLHNLAVVFYSNYFERPVGSPRHC